MQQRSQSEQKELPQIVPGIRPEGFVLVETSQYLTCGIWLFGIFTAVWYLVCFVALSFVANVNKPRRGSQEGGLLAVGVMFLFGLLPLVGLIRAVRVTRAFARQAELLVPRWPLVAGESVDMSFQARVRRNLTAMSLDVALKCEKVDRQGSETKHTLVDHRALSLRNFEQQDRLITGKWQLGMPADWPLPSKSEMEDINWVVEVVVELADGPKGVFRFPLLVLPGRDLTPPAESTAGTFEDSQALPNPDEQI